jgi:hypothetical protein
MQPRLLPWAAATNFITIGTTGERVVMSDILKTDMRASDFEQIGR